MQKQDKKSLFIDLISILGRKWSLFILSELLAHTYLSFSEIRKQILKDFKLTISPRVLSDSLQLLEENKIVNRNVMSEYRPIRVFYQLTEKGEDLRIVIGLLQNWEMKWKEKEGDNSEYEIPQWFFRQFEALVPTIKEN